jgi:hypothetical protein
VAWPTRRRVLALVGARADGRSSVAVVDPVARRVLRRTPIAADISDAASRPSGLVLLAAPRGAIGPATLIAIGPSGRQRTIALGPIAAGTARGSPSMLRAGTPGSSRPTRARWRRWTSRAAR